MSDSEPKCHCGESGYYHCSELREKLEEMRNVIKVILEADCLKSHAFERVMMIVVFMNCVNPH